MNAGLISQGFARRVLPGAGEMAGQGGGRRIFL